MFVLSLKLLMLLMFSFYHKSSSVRKITNANLIFFLSGFSNTD